MGHCGRTLHLHLDARRPHTPPLLLGSPHPPTLTTTIHTCVSGSPWSSRVVAQEGLCCRFMEKRVATATKKDMEALTLVRTMSSCTVGGGSVCAGCVCVCACVIW